MIGLKRSSLSRFGRMTLAAWALALLELARIPSSFAACRDYGDYFHWESAIEASGFSGPFAVTDGIVVHGSSGILSVTNARDAQRPVFVGLIDLGGSISSIEIADNIGVVVGCASSGRRFLATVEISDSSAPELIGMLEMEPGHCSAEYWKILAVTGTTVILPYSVVDISNPEAPQVVATGTMAPDGIAVAGNLAYTTNKYGSGQWGLSIYDIQDIARPVLLGSLVLAGTGDESQIAVQGGMAYVAVGTEWIYGSINAVDVSSADRPALLSFRSGIPMTTQLSLSGTHLFVSSFLGSLIILDVSEPSEMRQLRSIYATSFLWPGSMRFEDGFIYLSQLDVIALAQVDRLEDAPRAASLVVDADALGLVTGPALALVYGSRATMVVNTSASTIPVVVGEIVNRADEDVNCAVIDGDVAYLGCRTSAFRSTIRAYDLSTPETPNELGEFAVEQVSAMAATERIAYVIGSGHIHTTDWVGLAIVDFTTPATPRIRSVINSEAFSGPLVADNGHLFVGYVAESGSGVRIYSVTNPATPELIADLVFTQYIEGLDVESGQLHVSLSNGSLATFDLIDLPNPRCLSSTSIMHRGMVRAAGGSVFVADQHAGVGVVDMQDPASPRISGLLPARASEIALSGDHDKLLVLDESDSDQKVLAIYEVECSDTEPPAPTFDAIKLSVIAYGTRDVPSTAEFYACDEMEIGPFTDCAGSDGAYSCALLGTSTAVLTNEDLDAPLSYQGRDTIRHLYLLSQSGIPVGDIGFVYPRYFHSRKIAKQVIAFLHNDLSSYQQHPVEHDNGDWERLKYWRGRTEELPSGTQSYPVSMLVPPFREGGERAELAGSYDVTNVDPGAQPVLFVHGLYGTDMYWGTEREDFDYTIDSVSSQLRRAMEGAGHPVDVWEFYYPGDQSWLESGVLLERAVRYLRDTVGYSSPVAVVAHSMGGLVARSFVESKARAFAADGEIASSFVPGQIDRCFFLGTPHHGSFGGNRMFGEFWFNEYGTLFGQQQDPEAPAIRELSIGSSSMMRLNAPFRDGTTLQPAGVTYTQLMGTTHRGMVPELLGAPIIKESNHNSDGIVAASSGSLMRVAGEPSDRIPLVFMNDFCHAGLKDPALFRFADRAGTADLRSLLDAGRALDTYVSRALSGLLAGQSIGLPGGEYTGIDGSTASLLSLPDEIQIALSPQRHRFDVGLPVVSIADVNGLAWRPGVMSAAGRRPARFYVGDTEYDDDGKPAAIELVYQHLASSVQIKDSPNRLSLLYAGNMFQGLLEWVANDRSRLHKQRLAYERTAFYGFQEDRLRRTSTPLSRYGNTAHFGEGCGWSLPDNLVVGLGVSISTVGLDPAGRPAVIRLGRIASDQTVWVQRTTTAYSDIRLPTAVLRCLDTGRFDVQSGVPDAHKGASNTINYTIMVDADTPRLVVVVNELRADSEVAAVAPNATEIDLRRYVEIERHEDLVSGVGIYVVEVDEPGAWSIATSSPSAPESPPIVSVGLNHRHDVIVAYEYADEPRTRLVVSAQVAGPDEDLAVLTKLAKLKTMDGAVIAEVELRDDGAYPDDETGDRIYSAEIPVVAQDGLVVEADFQIEVDGTVLHRTNVADMIWEDNQVPAANGLIVSAYPNPFNPTCNLMIRLPRSGAVDVALYDLLGRRVRTIQSGNLEAGTHECTWDGATDDGRSAPSGTYLWQVRTIEARDSRKVTLVR